MIWSTLGKLKCITVKKKKQENRITGMWIKNETWSGMKKSQIIRAIVNEIQRIEAENLPEKENNSITVLKCVWDGLRIQWDLLIWHDFIDYLARSGWRTHNRLEFITTLQQLYIVIYTLLKTWSLGMNGELMFKSNEDPPLEVLELEAESLRWKPWAFCSTLLLFAKNLTKLK